MAEVKNYKRKPTVVQAIQFTGNNFDELKIFIDNILNKNKKNNNFIGGVKKILYSNIDDNNNDNDINNIED
jgi:hypothetical protein